MSYIKFLFKFLFIIHINSFQIPYISRYCSKSSMKLKMNLINRDEFFKFSSVFGIYYISTSLNNNYLDLKYNDENKQINIFKNTQKSICFISTYDSNYNLSKSNGVGTGFLWDKEGHIITNFHVINKINNANIILNNNIYKAKITGIEPEKDIAILKIDLKNQEKLRPIEIGNINEIVIGQYSYAIGNPFGLNQTFTMGIISGINREIISPTGKKIKGIIQTDTPINPGNSGGPLLNSKGKIIGMNTAYYGNGVSSGVGFAIPINVINETVNQIIKNGKIKKAIIGVSYFEKLPTKYESEILGIPEIKKGIIISNVPKNSKTGLIGTIELKNKTIILGDIIIGIDNYDINNFEDLCLILDKYNPNDKIKLKILRNNKEIILNIILTTYDIKYFTNIEIDN